MGVREFGMSIVGIPALCVQSQGIPATFLRKARLSGLMQYDNSSYTLYVFTY